MKNKIPYNLFLNKITAYKPGKSGNKKIKKKIIKMSSNESPLSFDGLLKSKIQNVTLNFNRYPDPNCSSLRESISKKYKIKSKNIIFGNGSDEIFFLISYAFLEKGLQAIYSKYGFLIYPIAIKATGAKAVYANEIGYKASVENILKKCNSKTRICFIANPNNPTGTYLTIKEIRKLRENLPKKCLLVVDSAYSEYVIEKDYSDSISYAKKREDIIVTHTFSKIYGIPSLRLGWAYCPENIISILNKIRPAFNINSYAQQIGKIVLEDQKYLEKSIRHNLYWKNWLELQFKELNLTVVKGVANFILLNLKNRFITNHYVKYLEKENIIIRKLDSYKLENCVRISIGLEKENRELIKFTKLFFKEKTS